MTGMSETWERWKSEIRRVYRKGIRWTIAHVPPGARTLVGLLLMVGGVFGALPILGFWMIPLGIAVILMDVTVLRRWWRGRPVRWRRGKRD